LLSHDVDWRRQGAPLEHIIARKDRFAKEVLENTEYRNPYYNIPEYIYLEERFDIRSTFFFRTFYENGDYRDYEDDIRTLINGGWEVGLHSDPSSVNDINKIYDEKTKLETLTKTSLRANRVHYLAFNKELPSKLQKLDFVYDSSLRRSRYQIDKDEMECRIFDTLIEFPVTLMDAYMFTYMKVTEDNIIDLFEKTLDYSRKLKKDDGSFNNIITLIWHDNVLQMKGGRMYGKILEYLTSQDDVVISRGIDLARMVNNKLITS
jgi:hypothetical protein